MTAPPFDRAYRLTPGIRHYAWGDPHFVPSLLGIPNADALPYAELWFGAHPALPAEVALDDRTERFDALLAAEKSSFLGSDAAERFGGLPYLLKVLAAARPLSIQVHPTKAQAEAGFRREEQAGIPCDASHRNYRDGNHKPEVIVALTPFYALSGFRPLQEIETVLAGLPEIADLLPRFVPTPDGLRAVVEAYFSLPDDRVAPALARLVDRLRRGRPRDPDDLGDPVPWLLEADRRYSQPGRPDRGLLFVLLLELVRLDPGEALFQSAGVPHAYLRGAGVELMANSDNVLRCGLTPKHVDAGELLRIVDFASTGPTRVPGTPGRVPAERVYRTPAREFALAEWSVAPDRTVGAVAEAADTLVVTDAPEGETVRIAAAHGVLALPRGAACVVPHGVAYTVDATAPAVVFRASGPARSLGPIA